MTDIRHLSRSVSKVNGFTRFHESRFKTFSTIQQTAKQTDIGENISPSQG